MDLAAELADIGVGEQVYACGPDRMLDALQELARGWPDGTLHFEYFTSADSVLDPAREHAFEAVLTDSGLTIAVGADQTLFAALRSAGIDIQTDCGEGLCGTCEARVIEGEIDHRDRVLSQAERERGDRMMTCCSRAKGTRLVLGL